MLISKATEASKKAFETVLDDWTGRGDISFRKGDKGTLVLVISARGGKYNTIPYRIEFDEREQKMLLEALQAKMGIVKIET